MKRYQFRLGQLLRVRRIQEDQARQQVLAARRAAEIAHALAEQRRRTYDELPPSERAVLLAHIAERTMWELHAMAVVRAEEDAVEADAEVERRAEAWRARKQEVEVLERLDERRRAEHAAEVLRAEALELDDLATTRASAGPSTDQEDDRP